MTIQGNNPHSQDNKDTNTIQKNSYLLLAKVCSNTNNLIINVRDFFQKITLHILLYRLILLLLYPYLLKNYKSLVSLAHEIFLFLLFFQSNLNLLLFSLRIDHIPNFPL